MKNNSNNLQEIVSSLLWGDNLKAGWIFRHYRQLGEMIIGKKEYKKSGGVKDIDKPQNVYKIVIKGDFKKKYAKIYRKSCKCKLLAWRYFCYLEMQLWRMLRSTETWNVIAMTFKFALLVGAGTFLVALIFALLSVDQVKGSKVYQVMFSMPMAIASVPAASMFIFLLSSKGIVNRLLGLSIDWFGSADWALIAIGIVTIWSHVGSSYLYLLVGFRNVPMDLRESAKLDGAGWWSQVKNILLPIASPQIFFVVFLNILNSFKTFSYFKLLTGSGVGGSTDVLIYQIYKQAFVFGRFETACVYSVFLFLIIFFFTRLQFAFEKRAVHYQ